MGLSRAGLPGGRERVPWNRLIFFSLPGLVSCSPALLLGGTVAILFSI
jgi:hypothetical protein